MNTFDNLVPIFLTLIGSLLLFFGSTEIGFRLGLRKAHRSRDEDNAPKGIITGSILGLVSFLLAFTFSIAAQNYTDRRGIVLEEANAIGTAFLRADLLPEAEAQLIRSKLIEYTEDRVRAVDPDATVQEVFVAIDAAKQIHQTSWEVVAKLTRENPTPANALVISAINQVIDLHASRVALGTRYFIPKPIWISLFLVSCIALATTGYRYGESYGYRPDLLPGMVIAFALIVTLIADLNHPKYGFLYTDQAPMQDLLVALKEATH
jgi:hypothetical protein